MDTSYVAGDMNILTERIVWIDVAKGILILLVVLGHVLKGTTLFSTALIWIINSFHMPAFFIISGILTKYNEKISFVKYAKKRCIRLVIPYVCFEVIGGLWQMIWFGRESVNLKGIISGILRIRCHVGADWFLPTLFFAELLLFFLIKINRKKIYIFSISMAILLAFVIEETNYFVGNGKRISVALLFLLIGYLWKKTFIEKTLPMFAISFVGTLLVACTNKTVGIAMRQFNNPILFMIGGVMGTYIVLYMSQIIAQYKSLEIIRKIGRASLVIMGTHQNIIIPFNVLFKEWTSYQIKFLILTITIPVEAILIKFCARWIPTWVGVPINEIKEKKNETKKQNRIFTD